MTPETAKELLTAIQRLNTLLSKSPPHQTNAVDVLLSIVPLAGIVFGVALLFFFFLWRYKITQELIRSGQYVSRTRKDIRAFILLLGCLSTACGIPMTILFYVVEKTASYALLGGLLPLACGIGLLFFFAFSRTTTDE